MENKTRVVNLHDLDKSQMLDSPELFKAVGYLSMWNLSFPQVDIYFGNDTDIQAVYADNESGRKYVIMGIWRNGRYEFHS